MKFRCRPKFWRNFLNCSIGIVAISIIISIIGLLPSIIEGPNNIHYLKRTDCTVKNITYQPNLCSLQVDYDLLVLTYQNEWMPCYIPKFEIESSNGENCTWYHPSYFESEIDGFKEIGKTYNIGTQFSCVLDTLNNICIPDKNEVFIFIITITSLLFLLSILIGLFFYFRYRKNKNL